MQITFEDITALEWEMLSDHAEHLAREFNRMAEFHDDAENSELCQRYADHQRERRHAFKTLAALEEHDQTLYQEQQIVVTRRKHVTLVDVDNLLKRIADDPDTEGVEKLACNIVLDILAEVFDEEEEKIDD